MKCNVCGNEKMLVKTKHTTPGWAIVVAILFFPIGLLALLAKKERDYFLCINCGNKMDIDK